MAASKTKRKTRGKAKKPTAGRKATRRSGLKKTSKTAPKRRTSKAFTKPRAGTRRAAAFKGMDNGKRVTMMIEVLRQEYPDAHCMLNFSSPFELLIATILAAQCTDAMVNRVTETLFKDYPSPQSFVDAPSEDIEQAIFRTGFYRNKTKSIKKCCQTLVEKHDGEVPRTMDDLLSLGGVGRKTANCVLGNAFAIPGIVVDTHVKRLANRMGYSVESDPDKIESDLNLIVPHKDWTQFSHLLADHGRHVCAARKPLCDECPVEHLCPRILG